MLVYDIEIVKAIQRKDEPKIEGIEYCEGFHDHANAGISVICAYDWEIHRYRVFTAECFPEFETLANDRLLAGFNSIAFDDAVCAASAGLNVTTQYDLLRECWIADGLAPEFEGESHGGYGLDALSKANGLYGKTGHGAVAPVDWQQGRYGSVIDYCLEDVRLTARLIRRVIAGMPMKSPKTGQPFRQPIAQPNYEPPYNFSP